MLNSAQKKAIAAYRSRLNARGISRFEVQAPAADRDLIKALARKLASDTPESVQLRQIMQQAVAGPAPQSGGILAALRRSPLVGADLDLTRPRESGRRIIF